MNPIALHLASGASAFSGAVLLVLGAGVSAWCRGRWTKSLRTLLVWLGLVLMIASATPWPAWLDVLLGAASLGWFLAEEAPRVRRATGVLGPRGRRSDHQNQPKPDQQGVEAPGPPALAPRRDPRSQDQEDGPRKRRGPAGEVQRNRIHTIMPTPSPSSR
jgi:hypothetical protein